MNNKFIIANWKENPKTINEARELIKVTEENKQKIENIKDYKIEVAYAVPSLFAGILKNEGADIFLQDIFHIEEGPYTGKVGSMMAKSLGIGATLIGHSETREGILNKKGYTDEEISLKVLHANESGLWTCLCFGEEIREGDYLLKIKSQIDKSLSKVININQKSICFAYEPVWAIGKDAKRAATLVEVLEVINEVKRYLIEKYNIENPVVLYGGSVDDTNAKTFLVEKSIDGLLVGRASADKDKWQKFLTSII